MRTMTMGNCLAPLPLLDEVEGGVAEGRPWWLFSGHHSRASVANPISWPEGGTGERCRSPPFPRA